MRKNLLSFTLLFIILSILQGCQEQKKISKIDLNELTINEVHKAFKNKEYNSEDLVSAYIQRIEELNKTLNAIILINPEALSIAKKLDEEYRETGVMRPLHGIPIIVKDNYNTKGMLTSAGSLALNDFIPDQDAYMVAQLVKAGAIIIAKSNMAEWAFSAMHTESSTFGTTVNPYNTEYVPAGSSGGTAAAVAANMGLIGIGTDTGNSIRGPSSHCALVGIRPTLGLTSRSGIIPLYLRNDTGGPMCRTVEDATKVMDIISGYDAADPITAHSIGKIPDGGYQQFLKKDGLKGARIGVLRELIDGQSDAEVKMLFEKAILDMKRLGAIIIDTVVVPDFSKLSQNQWCDEFRNDIEDYLATYVKRDTMKTLEDIIRVGSKSKYASENLLYFSKNSGRPENPEITCGDAYTDVRRIAFREAIENTMDKLKLDAIVYPTWNNKPAKIESFEKDYKGDNNQIIAPHTGQPAITVPMGFCIGNLPAGIQFLGRMFDEPTLIRLAYSFEQGTRHRKPPVVL